MSYLYNFCEPGIPLSYWNYEDSKQGASKFQNFKVMPKILLWAFKSPILNNLVFRRLLKNAISNVGSKKNEDTSTPNPSQNFPKSTQMLVSENLERVRYKPIIEYKVDWKTEMKNAYINSSDEGLSLLQQLRERRFCVTPKQPKFQESIDPRMCNYENVKFQGDEVPRLIDRNLYKVATGLKIGPQSSEIGTYKNSAYFSHHHYSFYDYQVNLGPMRLPQPSNEKKNRV